jgi:hypothetical protein
MLLKQSETTFCASQIVGFASKVDQPLSFTSGLQPGVQQHVGEPRNRFNGLLGEVTDNIEVL